MAHQIVIRTPPAFRLFNVQDRSTHAANEHNNNNVDDQIAPVHRFSATLLRCDRVTQYARAIVLLTLAPLVNDERDVLSSIALLYDQTYVSVQCQTVVKEVILDSTKFKAACTYTIRILEFLAMQPDFDRASIKVLPYLILPATTTPPIKIAWEEIFVSVDRPAEIVELFSSGLMDTLNIDDDDVGALHDRTILEGTSHAERPLSPIRLRRDVKVGDLMAVAEDGSTLAVTQIDGNKKFKKLDVSTIDVDQPLLEVISVPKASDYLLGGMLNKRTSCAQRFITVPQVCWVGPTSVSMLRACRIFPSILTHLRRTLLAREVNVLLLRRAVTDEALLLRSLTLPAADPRENFEQLEFFGDCVLQLCATCLVFCQDTSADEGTMDEKRKRLVENAHLTRIMLSAKIDDRWTIAQHVFAERSVGKHWTPDDAENHEKVVNMTDKALADLIESLIGAAWLSSKSKDDDDELDDEELRNTFVCLNSLNVLGQPVSLDMLRRTYRAQTQHSAAALLEDTLALRHRLALEKIVGYTFTSHSLALQSITHSGVVKGSVYFSYERLEFLGDAVLDWCVARWLYTRVPGRTQGEYSSLKTHIVCNASLARVCLSSGLDAVLRHHIHTLDEQTKTFQAALRLWITTNGPDKIEVLTELGAPKQLADVVESIIGAVFIDSNFSLRAANAVFRRLFDEHLAKFLVPNLVVVNPSQSLPHTIPV